MENGWNNNTSIQSSQNNTNIQSSLNNPSTQRSLNNTSTQPSLNNTSAQSSLNNTSAQMSHNVATCDSNTTNVIPLSKHVVHSLHAQVTGSSLPCPSSANDSRHTAASFADLLDQPEDSYAHHRGEHLLDNLVQLF